MPTSITSSGITFDDATTLTTGVLPTANIANGAVTPAKLSQPYTLATSVASTSGTAIDFTGIPSWVKRISVTIANVSTSGSSNLIVRLGTSGGFQTTGYTGSIAIINNSPAYTNTFSDVGLLIVGATAASISLASATIVNHTGNVWICSGTNQRVDGATFINGYFCGGTTLLGTLDRVRITTVNGTDTFDAGTINISYEG